MTIYMEYWQPWKLTWPLVSKVFIRAPSYWHNWQPIRLISVSSSLGDWADITRFKVPTLNHILLSDWLKDPRQKKAQLSNMTLQGLRDSLSQTKGKAHTSLLARLNSLQHRPLKGQNLVERVAIKGAVTSGWGTNGSLLQKVYLQSQDGIITLNTVSAKENRHPVF